MELRFLFFCYHYNTIYAKFNLFYSFSEENALILLTTAD